MELRRGFFIGLVLCSLIIILLDVALLLGVSVDPTLNEVVNFAWSARVVTPSVVGHPIVNLAWGSSIVPPRVVDEPNARLSSYVWVVNSTGLYTGSGSLVMYPWVNCSYLVRKGYIIIPAIAGVNASGYVDINVSDSALLQYLIPNPTSALITLDGSTTPLKYYVYDVNTTYIIYRVVLENVSDGPHILWVYAGGNGKYGVLGVPYVVTYSGTPLSNYTVIGPSGNYVFYDANGSELPSYTENGVTYVRLPVVNNGTTVFYVLRTVNASVGNPGAVFDWFDGFETFTGWVNYSLGNLYWSSTYKYAGSHGVVKNDNNDPNGGYKDLGFNITRPFVLEAEIERINTNGGAVDRVGVIDASGNGYGFAFDEGLSYLEIDKRSAYSATVLKSASITKPSGWYLARMYWFPNGTIITEIIQNGKVLGKESTTDTTYSVFNRVYIFGGYEYAVDNMRIRYISPIGDLYANPSTMNAITLLNITALKVENRPSSCVVTVTATTTVKPNAAYVPPQTSTTPYVTWVSPPPYVTEAESGNAAHNVVEHIRNAVVYLLKNPLVLILMLMMLGGFLLIVGGSRRRY